MHAPHSSLLELLLPTIALLRPTACRLAMFCTCREAPSTRRWPSLRTAATSPSPHTSAGAPQTCCSTPCRWRWPTPRCSRCCRPGSRWACPRASSPLPAWTRGMHCSWQSPLEASGKTLRHLMRPRVRQLGAAMALAARRRWHGSWRRPAAAWPNAWRIQSWGPACCRPRQMLWERTSCAAGGQGEGRVGGYRNRGSAHPA